MFLDLNEPQFPCLIYHDKNWKLGLYQDILALEGVRRSKKISQILQLLAFQIGQEVSETEIGQKLGINKATVARYLDLLEKTFILVNITGFNRNQRTAVTQKSRYYFYDLGVRNALIKQFNPVALRNPSFHFLSR